MTSARCTGFSSDLPRSHTLLYFRRIPGSSKEVPSVEKFLVTTVPAPLNPHCLPIAARFLQFTISRKIFVFPVKSLLLAYCVALG